MRILEFDSYESEQQKREMQMQEPVVAKKNIFIYTVYEDDDEKDSFFADVRDPNGTVIYEIKEKDFPKNPEEEEAYEIEEKKEGSVPRMHDANDIQSLRKILIAKGKMSENDVLMSNEIYRKTGEIEKPEVPPVNINTFENNQYEMKHIKLFENFLNEGATTLFMSVDGSKDDMMKKFKDRVDSVESPGSYSGDWDAFGGVKTHNTSIKFKDENEVIDYIEQNQEKWEPAMAIEWQPNKWIVGGWVSESISEGTHHIDEPVLLLAMNSKNAEEFKEKLAEYKEKNPDTYINDLTDAQHRLDLPLGDHNDAKMIFDKIKQISK